MGEIEAALRSVDGVASAVVVMREDVAGDKRLVGYVVAAGGATPDAASLSGSLRQTLPAAMVPSAFIRKTSQILK